MQTNCTRCCRYAIINCRMQDDLHKMLHTVNYLNSSLNSATHRKSIVHLIVIWKQHQGRVSPYCVILNLCARPDSTCMNLGHGAARQRRCWHQARMGSKIKCASSLDYKCKDNSFDCPWQGRSLDPRRSLRDNWATSHTSGRNDCNTASKPKALEFLAQVGAEQRQCRCMRCLWSKAHQAHAKVDRESDSNA